MFFGQCVDQFFNLLLIRSVTSLTSLSYLLDDFGRIKSAFGQMSRKTSFCDLGCIVFLLSGKEQTPTHC